MAMDSESVLIERFSLKGDSEAFAEIIRRHARMVYDDPGGFVCGRYGHRCRSWGQGWGQRVGLQSSGQGLNRCGCGGLGDRDGRSIRSLPPPPQTSEEIVGNEGSALQPAPIQRIRKPLQSPTDRTVLTKDSLNPKIFLTP
jgi:hypothetical protein